MYTHRYELVIDTQRALSRDEVRELVFKLLKLGADEAQDICDDPDREQAARNVADDALSLNISVGQ